jgi:endopeptidase Clp ATP-binding regulatory subunit ClpX
MSDNKPEAPKPGTAEEITRKLEEFINNSLGGQVLFTRVERASGDPEPAPPEVEEPAAEEPEVFEFKLKPADIKAHLDRYVIRQDDAKKVLATAVCDHYNHARMLRESEKTGQLLPEFSKQNVLIIGPTGVGKTYLVKHIADLIGVPFVKADATKFSETGYVGGDVDDLVRDLVAKAGGDVERAEHGIIYLDEIDKLATLGDRMGRDVSGRGVQTAMLKLMEETEVALYPPNDIRTQMHLMFNARRNTKPDREVINTRNILFIVSGAFAGLEKIIEKRASKSTIGFIAVASEKPGGEALLKQSRTQDLIDYGFEAEFVGRLPVRVICESLKADDLFQIMKNSEGSLIRQFEREFSAYGVCAVFEDSALHIIAERAAEEKTGARGLVTAWEQVLRDFKFELPSLGLPELKVDGALVNDPQAALARCREEAQHYQHDVRSMEVQAFADQFKHEHGIELRFEHDAVRAIIERVEREGSTVRALCARLFKDYPFGLQLVARNLGTNTFTLNRSAVGDTDKHLGELVAQWYQPA